MRSRTAARGPSRAGAARHGWRLAISAVAIGTALGLAAAGGGAAAVRSSATATFTGYGFDACNAPSTSTLQAWLSSPYRAVGVYIGGINRACPNNQLTPDWISTAVSGGWSLIPIYVGLQAPCVTRAGPKRMSAASASSQGTAAADDAAGQAVALTLPAGSPIYLDLEAYAPGDPACTQTVQTFVTSWVTELHLRGYVAGVYGSAASVIRDLEPLANTTVSPDDIWIADWNGQRNVFGNPYVPDELWANHQRLHQYRGGHKETYGGVTIDIDSSYLDGAVVNATGNAPPPPPPPPVPTSSVSAAGSLSSPDGEATVSWPAGTFLRPVVVTLTPSAPPQGLPGFGSGGYGLQLEVQTTSTAQPTSGFGAPLTIHISPQSGDNLAPMYSANGIDWKPLPQLVNGVLPAGAAAGYAREPNGSVDVQTTAAAYFALLPETGRPPAPVTLSGHVDHGSLVLRWPKSKSASGTAISYEVTLTNRPLLSVDGQTTAAVRAFHPDAPSVFRVQAIDAAGKTSQPSKPLVVLPSKRPAKLPKAIPAWAWQLFDWQQSGRIGTRPAAPRTAPAWYWRWAAWRTFPFHIRA